MRKLLALLVAMLQLSCGAGGGLAQGGGVGGTGISAGAISGFGSIFVTGTEYDVNGAQIRLERANGSAADLRVGMVVVVEGERSADGTTGTAQRVDYDDEIEGPISALVLVTPDVLHATILGQTIVIERDLTRFDGSPPPTFDTLAVNDLVEVSGYRRTNDIQATYVKKKGVAGGTPTVDLKGTVAGVAGRSFLLGTLTVSWSASTELVDLPAGGPTNGDFVEVEGTLTAPAAISATRIEREGPFAGDHDEFELEGSVSDFVSLASFKVDGQPVDASGAGVQFEPNNPSLVMNGALVEAEGSLQAGVLIARKVKLREGEVRIHASVANQADVDPVAKRVVLLGIPVRVDSATRLEDDTGAVQSGFDLGDVVAGDFLEVRGFEDGAGGVVATELSRDQEDDVELRGAVQSIDAVPPDRSVTILGVVVPTDAQTEFEGVQDEDDFYAAVHVGDVIEVEDEQDGDQTAIDVADSIELDDD